MILVSKQPSDKSRALQFMMYSVQQLRFVVSPCYKLEVAKNFNEQIALHVYRIVERDAKEY